MNILLDTHAVWWFINGDEKLPKSTRETIINPENVIFVSIATLWEVAIKMSIGKLNFEGGIDGFIKAIEDEDFIIINITTIHIKTVADLPYIHRDPFDRIIISQAIVSKFPIVTTDSKIAEYNINTIW